MNICAMTVVVVVAESAGPRGSGKAKAQLKGGTLVSAQSAMGRMNFDVF